MEHIGGIYRHFKGNKYQLILIAKNSETLEKEVVYKALYGDESYWVRPYDMFFETIEKDGKKIKRFEYIGE